jgi:DNA-binding protein Fis
MNTAHLTDLSTGKTFPLSIQGGVLRLSDEFLKFPKPEKRDSQFYYSLDLRNTKGWKINGKEVENRIIPLAEGTCIETPQKNNFEFHTGNPENKGNMENSELTTRSLLQLSPEEDPKIQALQCILEEAEEDEFLKKLALATSIQKGMLGLFLPRSPLGTFQTLALLQWEESVFLKEHETELLEIQSGFIVQNNNFIIFPLKTVLDELRGFLALESPRPFDIQELWFLHLTVKTLASVMERREQTQRILQRNEQLRLQNLLLGVPSFIENLKKALDSEAPVLLIGESASLRHCLLQLFLKFYGKKEQKEPLVVFFSESSTPEECFKKAKKGILFFEEYLQESTLKGFLEEAQKNSTRLLFSGDGKLRDFDLELEFKEISVYPLEIPEMNTLQNEGCVDIAQEVQEFAFDLYNLSITLDPLALELLKRYRFLSYKEYNESILAIVENMKNTRATVLLSSHLPENFVETESAINTTGDELSLEEIEKMHILKVLERFGNDKTRTAQVLKISRRTLYNKLEKWGIM